MSAIDDQTVGGLLRRTASRFPAREALVFPADGVRWDWATLDRRVDAIASGLIAAGVGPGEHVALWAMNVPGWVVAQFAVARAGAVLVNVNPAYRLHELEGLLAKVDVSTLIVGPAFKSSDFAGMVEALCPEVAAAGSPGSWRAARLPSLRRLVAIGGRPGRGWLAWEDLMSVGVAHAALDALARTIAPSDVVNIQFTSGTTGMPKGAMLTHRNVLSNAEAIAGRLRLTEADRVCVPVPFYHCFGCVMGTLVCATSGAAMVVPAPAFDPAATLAAASSERCTALYGVPTMFVAELARPELAGYDLGHLRTGIMAGSPCPLPLMRAVVETLGAAEITIGYGQTESSPIITLTAADDPIEVRVGTVGRPIAGVEVRIIDPRTGLDVPEGEPGELCARGPNVMVGYYREPEATALAIDPDGWLHTGDLARRRADGNYRIVGRCKELIIRGGENIYPPEVEEYLCHHPAVAEVAVVGLPDPILGEAVSAWVVPRAGATLVPDDLRDFCRGQIAHYKIPRYVQLVDSLPRTGSGKVQKYRLRERGIADYGLEEGAPTA